MVETGQTVKYLKGQMKKKDFQLSLILCVFLTYCNSCAGTSSEPDEVAEAITDDTVNTAKLIGTPFEGYTTGDEFSWDYFLCNQYRTEIIDDLPIKIFTAFFTESEEATIHEGIDVANAAMGSTTDSGVFYEMTDVWTDNVRVIYLVNQIIEEINDEVYEYSAVGLTRNVESRFNGTLYADVQAPDWKIELITEGINKWVVAHELGHTSGILGHYLVDYENDIFTTALEEDSLMSGGHSRKDPALGDYTFMMQHQAEIIQDHLTTLGNLGGATCTN